MNTAEAVQELSKHQDLHKFFAQEGIKGYRYNSDSCPIANYIASKTGHDHSITTMFVINLVKDGFVKTPRTIADFLVAFDRGDFPDLVEGA